MEDSSGQDLQQEAAHIIDPAEAIKPGLRGDVPAAKRLIFKENGDVDLFKSKIDPTVVRLIPKEMAKRFCIMGVSKVESLLKVAMKDPLDIVAIDTVTVNTGLEIEPLKANGEDINAAIEKYYGEALDIEKSIQELVDFDVESLDDERADAERLKVEADDPPVIRLVNLIILQAIEQRASDIHVEPQEKSLSVRYRIDGVLRETAPPPKRMQSAIISRIKILSNLDIGERRLPQDGSCKVRVLNKEVDIRVSVLPTVHGEKVVMRILDKSNLRYSIEDLGLDKEDLARFSNGIKMPHGMILVTGPTGSGKTTTLYSALSQLNSPEKNIITVEEPVEYVIAGINQVQVRSDIGLSFSAGLRSILRQDPDIILVGEIRDQDTLSIAIKAALTGHLVFSTVHTNDAASTVTRLIDMGLEPYLIGSSLLMVVAQRLVRGICSECKVEYKPEPELLKRLNIEDRGITFYKGMGCEACGDTGYKGRMAIFEMLSMTPELRNMVVSGTNDEEIKGVAKKRGFSTLLESGICKVEQGLTTIDEVLSVAATEIE
jgi:type IV pilus assembly protein PilB